MIAQRKFTRRLYQNSALVAARKTRVLYLFWTRRGRKSTTLGDMAFDAMSARPGESVIAASASLLVGSELVSMAMTAAEQAIRIRGEAEAVRSALARGAEGAGGLDLQIANSETGKSYKAIAADDYADLYRSKRLEFRLYFDRTSYSRLIVIAPNPATARGWGGWVFRDEQMFTPPAMEAELQTATNPIIDTDPTFRLIYASNLGGDDRHPGYEMTLPRQPAEFQPDPAGHFYVSQTGITVHRVDLADAYAAGHTLFDKKTGKPISLGTALSGLTPNEKKQNYMLVHEASGTAAVDSLALHTAQARGVGRCAFVYVDTPADFSQAMVHLAAHLRRGADTGIGFDVATTTSEKSNPSAVTVAQRSGVEFAQPLVVVWKTRDPAVAKERLRRIIGCCVAAGCRPRRMCVDGSNEYYFAVDVQRDLRAMVPVSIIKGGEGVQPLPPGYRSAVNFKTFLGDQYTAEINDAHYAMPPEAYLKKDHRSVVKDRGIYTCDVDADGGHGDTFDSGKLAQYALRGGAGPVEIYPVEVDGVMPTDADDDDDGFDRAARRHKQAPALRA